MLEDKKRSSDWEATYDAIEEAVARESYLTWLRENEKRTLPERHAGSQVTLLAVTARMQWNLCLDTLEQIN